MEASRLKQLFLAAAALPEAAQAPWLERECADDPQLLRETQALLARDRDSAGFTRRLERIFPDPTASAPSPLESQASPFLKLIPGETVGTYTITRMLGSGGSSSVYEAVRAELDRPVAVKVFHDALRSAHARWRFEHEIRSLSRLEHPSVARVIDFGLAKDGRPYIVTERVISCKPAHLPDHEALAVPFARACRALPVPDRLHLILTLCDAVSHAHQRGVIHRDLKSANVLVATNADGSRRPVIVDFGIARSFDPVTHRQNAIDRTAYTSPGLVIGTVGTMAPEQASGDPDAVDTRTDVWGLGVLLFEAMTGELPHGQPAHGPGGLVAWLARVQTEEPRRARSIIPSLHADLDAIIAKSLARDRIARYSSPVALADDLRRYLADQPTHARPVNALVHAWKWTLRHRTAVAVAVIVFSLLSTATFALVAARNAQRRERDRSSGWYELLLGKVMDEARDLPATSALRRTIVADSEKGLREDLARRPDDPHLRALLARATTAAADLASASGDADQALKLHQAALESWDLARKLRPEDPEFRLERATQSIRVLCALQIPSPADRLPPVLDAHREFESIAANNPDLLPAATALCWSHERLASTYQDLHEPDKAETHGQIRLGLAKALVARYPMNADVRYNLSEAYIMLANRRPAISASRAELLDQSVQAAQALYEIAPLDRRSVHSLARALVMQAYGFRARNIVDAAESPSAKAMDLALQLWRSDSYDSLARWTMQAAAGERTFTQFERGDMDGALRSVDLCLEAIRRTESLEPKSPSLDVARPTMENHRAAILARLAGSANPANIPGPTNPPSP